MSRRLGGLMVLLACVGRITLSPVAGWAQEAAAPAEEADKAVTVTGEAPIENGDKFRARDEASALAKRNAVEQAVGTLITSETKVENFELISDRVLTKASGYVKRFEILKESVRDDSLLILAKCEVSVSTVKDDLVALNLLQAQKHKPRIMMLFFGEGAASPAADAVKADLGRRLLEKEFNVVEPPKKTEGTSGLYEAASGGDAGAAAKLGAKVGAEVVVTGVVKVSSKDLGSEMADMISCQAGIGAMAVNAGNGKVLASNDISEKTVHISAEQGIRKAGTMVAGKLADGLIEDIVKVWSQDVQSGETVQVKIKGISYNQLTNLEQLLQTHRGVADLHERTYEAEGKTGVFDIEYKGETRALAQDLMKLQVGRRPLELDSIQSGGLVMHLGEAAPAPEAAK